MANTQEYNLWFVNQSDLGGKVCVYQDKSNVKFNRADPKVLAWALTGANPSTVVRFTWTIDYNFVWFNYAPIRSQQIEPADLNTTNSVVLSRNQYGFYFRPPQSGNAHQFLISQDASLPSVSKALVGIGMGGAGTFAYPVMPNNQLTFTPVGTLSYWITFGQYTFEVNDPLTIPILNNPKQITFPYGVYEMTATLNKANDWNITPNINSRDAVANKVIVYEIGKGAISD